MSGSKKEASGFTGGTSQAFLDDGITAFELDDRLQEIETSDRTVSDVAGRLWGFYDDCKDHKVCLSKEEWNYFQRLLLLLRSHGELSFSTHLRWGADHALAWLAAGSTIVFVAFVGWIPQLIPLFVVFGIGSYLIFLHRFRFGSRGGGRETTLIPFTSFAEIRKLRTLDQGFKKRRYRTEVGRRKVRGRGIEQVLGLWKLVLWIVLSPVVLLIQGVPTRVSKSGIEIPEGMKA